MASTEVRYYTAEDDEYPVVWLQRVAMRALWTPYNFWTVAVLCLLIDSALTGLIMLAIPYTEIDYQTYMQQTLLFLKGERRYDKLTGDTGPCVYPALHLYLSAFLSLVSDAGRNLKAAQWIYAALYIFSQACTMAIYKAAQIPPIMLPLLILSKRLHSIYVLRLFNDCWAVVIMYVAVWAMCKRRWGFASVMYSLALGVKMNILLYAPAMAAIYLRSLGLQASLVEAAKVILIQLLLGGPFLLHDAKVYLVSAFDMSRVFLYKWTVNWRFIDESTFVDRRFSLLLLALHATLIATWLTFRWTGLRAQGLRWLSRSVGKPSQATTTGKARIPSARFIVSALFISNLIGITFARSLHYQFYSWYAQQIPMLVYLAKLPRTIKIALPICIELAWNFFPSTAHSSMLLFISHILLLFGLWRARHDDTLADEVRPDEQAVRAALVQKYDIPSRRQD